MNPFSNVSAQNGRVVFPPRDMRACPGTAALVVLFLAVPVTPSREWKLPQDVTEFTEIELRVDRLLSAVEIERTTGCLAYALTETLCGEELGAPEVTFPQETRGTTLVYRYNSRSSRRTEPIFTIAFQKASYYIVFGTPLRKTDRQGPGTKGTPLFQGIGQCSEVGFYVR